MNSKYVKSIIFLFLSILLISFNSNPSGDIHIIPMQQIGEDGLGDEGIFGLDLVSAYASSFDGLLMLTVVYADPGEWELYSNITLRNSLEELYMIQAASGEFNHFVGVYGATSLEDDSINSDDGPVVFYTEEWRVRTNFSEITMFVDWTDIGGEGPIDLVFWTGRPLDNPDKLPDTGFVSFDGVQTVDTTGVIDDPKRTNITTIDFGTSTSIGEVNGSITTPDLVTSTSFVDVNESITTEIITVIGNGTGNDTSKDTTPTITLPLSNSFIPSLLIIYFGYRKKNK